MAREFRLYPKTLHFKFEAGTSRGVYTTRDTYFIVLFEDGRPAGVGECAPLRGLSAEYKNKKAFEQKLVQFIQMANQDKDFNLSVLKPYSSILCAFETALLQAGKGSLKFFDNDFTQGTSALSINGLIWMGDFELMRKRLLEKIESGFKCIKLKIGAIDFNKELELLRLVRTEFSDQDLILRVDANGAFDPEEAMERLEALSKFNLHSIEQPIRAGQTEALSKLCRESPVPIALDEELIGHYELHDKEQLLDSVRPQYLVLKPSLHGGLKSTLEWTALARERGIDLWLTSALESNVGLNMLAQLTASLKLSGHQGLGTGQLYTDNVELPHLSLEGESLRFNEEALPASEAALWQYLR